MKADYGIDAPLVVRNLALGGVACLVAAVLSPWLRWFLCPGIALGGTAAVMVWGSKVGKRRLRDHLLDDLELAGDEQVLDIGCGRGLMLLGAARRLTTGRATGIDLWQTQDQSGNAREATLANARIEGVADRVELIDGDARSLPFPDASYDRIISSWALHNIPSAEGRETALREAVRVLRPGGRLAIADIQCGPEYVRHLAAMEMANVTISPPSYLFVIPTRTVTATKPDNPAVA